MIRAKINSSPVKHLQPKGRRPNIRIMNIYINIVIIFSISTRHNISKSSTNSEIYNHLLLLLLITCTQNCYYQQIECKIGLPISKGHKNLIVIQIFLLKYQMNNITKLAAQKLANSTCVLIAAGAGMGKDSGLPDFRGNQGFWNNYPPYRNKFNFQECANPNFLVTNPDLFWGFYGSRLIMYRQKAPHRGFHILKQISQKKKKSFVITSNVDGHFHQMFDFKKIFQVHGSIHHLQCQGCSIIIQNNFQPEIDFNEMSCKNFPKCKKCNSIMRPNIYMFNDWTWISERSDKQQKNYHQFLNSIQIDDRLAIIQIGCGKAVPTIRNMCENVYFNHKNSILIRINPQQESISSWMHLERYFHIQESALSAIQQLQKN